MARPKSGRNGEPVKLYINPEIRATCAKIAFNRQQSLSEWVESIMRKAAKKQEAAA